MNHPPKTWTSQNFSNRAGLHFSILFKEGGGFASVQENALMLVSL